MTKTSLTLAVAKGRIFREASALLCRAGIEPEEDPEETRKLAVATREPEIGLLIIRAQDVPTYVQYGAADLGITGKDVLMEHGGEGIYEPLDLGIARCRMMVAGREGDVGEGRRLRVATKYVHTARRYYAAKGRQAEIIHLYGAMELAPIVGLADRIVDLVDTGGTLRANGLVPMEHITDISARLLVNRAAMKMKHGAVRRLIDRLTDAVAEGKPT
ncbi:MAG: ATP phosphoribosyltransferase [Gammaproteobacteria bacterium]|nr:MAG: ATP phosphoribosyltransferase [Gammaproteobacteria bacterium]